MSHDQEYPVAHTWLFVMVLIACALALLFLMTGCGTIQAIQTVQVPVPVACQETVPDRPAMPTEEFQTEPTLDQFTRAAIAELERREGYEGQLRAALEACTAPIGSNP